MSTITLASQLLERQRGCLEEMDSLDGLDRWRDAVIEDLGLAILAGLPVPGQRSVRQAASSPDPQPAPQPVGPEHWTDLFAARLQLIQADGVLRGDADPVVLATGLMAAFQGGYLLAWIHRDTAFVQIALDTAIKRIKAYAEPGLF